MKSLHIFIVFSFLSSFIWAGSCGKGGSCGNNRPLFQSPFPTSQGSFTQDSNSFIDTGVDTLSGLGGGTDSFGKHSFDSLNFDSRGARIQCRGGFLEIAGQPIFIGKNGEILVKDPVTGQLLPADSNTTAQVLNHYQDWARRIENGELPNDSRFAIAQRALASNSSGNFSGGFASPFAANPNGVGGTQANPNFRNLFDPSVPPSGAQQTQTQTQPPASNPVSPTSPGNHAEDSNNPSQSSERPKATVPADEQNFHSSIDKEKLRVFSDGQGHYFFTNKEQAGKQIFSGDSKLAFEMNKLTFAGDSSKFELSFEDSRFKDGKVKIDGDTMKLACGEQNKEFKELKDDEAKKALEAVQFRPLPQTREHLYLGKTRTGDIIYVSRDKYKTGPEQFKLYLQGDQQHLEEIALTSAQVLSDGSSTTLETKAGTFTFPSQGTPSFKAKQEGIEPISIELMSPSEMVPEEIEKLIGKSLMQEISSKPLHTLCDQFEKP